MKIDRIHHVAYRCMDANRTVDFYKKFLDMDLVLAISEDKVPSTGEPDPYIHIFLDAGSENVLAFFEIPNSPMMDGTKIRLIGFNISPLKSPTKKP